MTSDSSLPTELLNRTALGERVAADQLMELVYEDFRRLAAKYLRHEPANLTLQPTALVHEAFLRLIDQNRMAWQGRTHFLAIGAQAMRRILIDHARGKGRKKRGGMTCKIQFDETLVLSPSMSQDLLDVEELLTELQELSPIQAQIVELRFFGGMTSSEVAEYLGISKSTTDRHWRAVRAWIRKRMSEEQDR